MFKPTQSRPREEISDHQPHLSRAADAAAWAAAASRPARGDCQALAELGFIVVEIDGMGTPWRSKKFHEAYYGDMGDNTLPDQVAGMKQLAQALSVDRPRSRGHLRPLRRRLCHGRRDVPLSRFLQGGDFGIRQSRQSRIRRRLGREVAGAAEDEKPTARPITTARPIRTVRQESERPSAAGARHHGQQRAAVQYAAGGERADQGEQGFRPAAAAQSQPRFRQ